MNISYPLLRTFVWNKKISENVKITKDIGYEISGKNKLDIIELVDIKEKLPIIIYSYGVGVL